LPLGLGGIEAQDAGAETFSDDTFFSELVVQLDTFAPVGVAFAPDGRLFIWEKAGVVRIFKPGQNGQQGQLLPAPFVDIQGRVNQFSDRGLLGIALHPNFATNGYVYLLYTFQNGGDPFDSGPKTARLTRVTADPDNPDVALPGSEVVLLGSIGGGSCNNRPAGSDCIPSDSSGHSIGMLRFGPDRKLFVSIGDGAEFDFADADALRAQRLDSYAGKLLRINANGRAPGDNPFDDGTNSIRSRVYAFGLRNPFRFTLDPDGEPYIADVGWFTFEEINRGRGANFGWPCYEGDAPHPDYQDFQECQDLDAGDVVPPLHPYPRSEGVTVIGGPFYTGTVYPPQYRNNYFFADYNHGWIRRLILAPDRSVQAIEEFATGVKGIVHLELGPDGLLYYVNIVTGQVRRIATGPNAVASAKPRRGYSPLTVTFSSKGSKDTAGGKLSYSWDFGDGSPTSTLANPRHVYVTPDVTTFTATLTATVITGPNTGMSSSRTVRVTLNSKPPVPTILSPANGATVVAGQTVSYKGTATDVDNHAVMLAWQVLLRHDAHLHTFVGATGEEGTFVVEDHGAGTYKYEIVLSATDASGLTASRQVTLPVGLPAVPSASPEAVAFPARPVGASSGARTITVRNDGPGTLKLKKVMLGGANPTQFGMLADTCSTRTLGPGKACTVQVRFRPTAAGAKSAELLIRPWSPVQDPTPIELTGEGIP
jgi:glucose/arabinose dehydrogenase